MKHNKIPIKWVKNGIKNYKKKIKNGIFKKLTFLNTLDTPNTYPDQFKHGGHLEYSFAL